MNAATAALLGAGIGILGTLVSTWINRHFDEKKARRELMVKTGWDHYSTLATFAKDKGGGIAPFETYLFHTLKIVELALNDNSGREKSGIGLLCHGKSCPAAKPVIRRTFQKGTGEFSGPFFISTAYKGFTIAPLYGLIMTVPSFSSARSASRIEATPAAGYGIGSLVNRG
jgi:hypothetical protein